MAVPLAAEWAAAPAAAPAAARAATDSATARSAARSAGVGGAGGIGGDGNCGGGLGGGRLGSASSGGGTNSTIISCGGGDNGGATVMKCDNNVSWRGAQFGALYTHLIRYLPAGAIAAMRRGVSRNVAAVSQRRNDRTVNRAPPTARAADRARRRSRVFVSSGA